MNETNRMAIVILAALAIIAMAVAAFIAWAEPDGAIGRLEDFVQYLNDHNDDASKLILTLGALTVVILAILVIVVELAPEQQATDLRVEQGGATTIVSAEGLQRRLEEVLLTLPSVTAAKVNVAARNKGIATDLDLTVLPGTNVGMATQEAIGIVVHAVQQEMGLPLSEAPRLRITYASAGALKQPAAETQVPDQEL